VDDARGCFAKPFSQQEFRSAGLGFQLEEIFWSFSTRGTIRGMHFQIPPKASKKLVWCSSGLVTDVILDLRKNSTTFGDVVSAVLGATGYLGIFVPEGCAHGFEVQEANAIISYATSAPYVPELDLGIRWDSIEYSWGNSDPILSDRDRSFPALVDFKSPF
jgi:dTDP-4-dehydrorhamnose 3,5-epimerase